MPVQKNRFAYMSQSSFQLSSGGWGKCNFSADVTGSKTVKAALNKYCCFCCFNIIVNSRRYSEWHYFGCMSRHMWTEFRLCHHAQAAKAKRQRKSDDCRGRTILLCLSDREKSCVTDSLIRINTELCSCYLTGYCI